jgi:SAM-dependent methyltransferase
MASDFKFPYRDETFNLVFATSVFTHILPSGVVNYFSEIVRVLKHDGRFYSSFFLLTPKSLSMMASRKSVYVFHPYTETVSVEELGNPELGVAYQEAFIRNLYQKNNLEIKQLYYGSWFGQEKDAGLQDIIVGLKR